MNAGNPKTTVSVALTRPAQSPATRPTAMALAGSSAQHLQAISSGAAGERQHRADREVDIARCDHVGEADRDQRQLGIVEQDCEGVGQVPPIVGAEPEADQPEDDREYDGERVAAGEELPKPARGKRPVCRHRALGLDALDGDAADFQRRRRRLATKPRPEAGRDPAADDVGLDRAPRGRGGGRGRPAQPPPAG